MKNKLHLILPLLLLACGISQAASIYTSGHGDLGIAYAGPGELELHHHIHLGSVVDGLPLGADDEYQPADLIVTVANPSAPRQAGAAFDFIGVVTGQPVWHLPQTEDISKPFYGIGSEELDPFDWTGNLTLTLLSITAPGGGYFSLWQDDGLGGVGSVLWATSDGITGADAFNLTPGGHAHYNWSFTQPGIYQIEVKVNGVHSLDGAAEDTEFFTFHVAPEPSRAMLMFVGMTGLMLRRRRK